MQNDFSAAADQYEKLVVEEDNLSDQIQTCNKIMDLITDNLFLIGDTLHMLTVKEIVIAVNRIEQRIQTELHLLRITKGIYAIQLRQARERSNI